jgi:hypothetical protein
MREWQYPNQQRWKSTDKIDDFTEKITIFAGDYEI